MLPGPLHSQTLAKRSSPPPKPPDLPLLELLFPFLIGAGVGSAHPPKSSSAATAGAGLAVAGEGSPQPLPMSFAVKVSGTFIADVAFEAAAGGDGSAMLHAFPPQGSRVLAVNAFEGLTVLVGGDLTVGCCGGKERLKTEVWLGEATGGEVLIVSVAVGAVVVCGTATICALLAHCAYFWPLLLASNAFYCNL